MKKYLNKIVCMFFVIAFLLPNFSFALADTSAISITSPAAILIHPDTGIILYEKNAYTKQYPASTTKIMTAILAIESEHSLSDIVTVSSSAISTVPDGYTIAYLQEGEEFTLEQLLEAALIPSANDAANVLAEFIGGSIENFANLMNEKAIEIGCVGTHFVNPSGIHSDDHYSTAYDLSIIARYAMKNDIFRKIVAKTSCYLPPTNQYPYNNRYFRTTNSLIIPSTSGNFNRYYYPYAIGIKTGYTSPAKNCLVAASAHDDLEFITVVLGGIVENDGANQRFSDTIKLFDFAFKNYSYKNIVTKDSVITETVIDNGTSDTKNLDLLCDKDIKVFINSNNNEEVLPEIKLNEKLNAPIQKGEILGKVKYTVLGQTYEANLIASHDVELSTIVLKLFSILIILLIVTLVIIIINSEKHKKISK